MSVDGSSTALLSRRDIDFILYEWLDVTSLIGRPLFAMHDQTIFEAVLDLSESLANDYFVTHFKKSDASEPHFDGQNVQIIPEVKEAHEAFIAAGLMTASHSLEVGGMQLPTTIEKAAMVFFHAANASTFGYLGLSVAAANLLLEQGDAEQVRRYAMPLLEGRFYGTMCLSEPQAGSSLGDIVTRAELQDDGTYRLFGTKMWISAGEHSLSETIVHLVLAKIPGGPAGTKGISLFLVPRDLINEDGAIGERNDVSLIGLNHKMGARGTANCVLNFGGGDYTTQGKAGAIGYLVGEVNHGLAGMFMMMNEARIGVGSAATACGYRGYLLALDYAQSRAQGRSNGAKDPTSAQVPLITHPDIRRMLLAQKSYVEAGLAFNLYCARLFDEQRSAEEEDARNAGLMLDLLTPVAKSWPSQWCLAANDFAIQIHGGYGYTRDYDVEQLYRDNRLNAIHEGTHGIQALDLLGRKVVMRNGAAFRMFLDRIAQSVVAAKATADPQLADYALQLDAAWQRIAELTVSLHGQNDPALTLSHATTYLEAFGHACMAWIWLEQVTVCHGKIGNFYDGKRAAAEFFYGWELPKLRGMFEIMDKSDRLLVDCASDIF